MKAINNQNLDRQKYTFNSQEFLNNFDSDTKLVNLVENCKQSTLNLKVLGIVICEASREEQALLLTDLIQPNDHHFSSNYPDYSMVISLLYKFAALINPEIDQI